jgi:hypothetical protein
VFESAGRREEVLDERADYGIATNKEGAYLGIHDVFDVEEAGVRSVDSLGVVGAAVDQVRISKNYGTVYGRLGNFFSEPAMKYVLRNADPDTFDEVDQSLVDSMTSAGKWEYLLGDGRTITAEEAAAEMRKLGASLLDPRMDVEAMKRYSKSSTSVVDGTERLGVDTKGNIAYGWLFASSPWSCVMLILI